MIDSIRLGLMPPLTGLVGIYGSEISWAARIACEKINERGGILGLPLELIIEDDGSLPATAVPAAERLVDSHRCIALIGNLLSNSRIAVIDQVAEPKRIPLLNFSFYEGSISSRYFFHFAALPNQQIDKMIPYMAKRYGLKMFFSGNNYEWPRGSIDAGKRILRKLGGDIVGEEYLPIGANIEQIDGLLKQIACSGADVFVPYFAGNDQINLLNRFAEMGLKKHMAVVMGHYDEMMVSRLPASVRDGFYSSSTYFMSLDTRENRRYLQRLVGQPEVNGIWPHGNGVLTNFGEGAYLCVLAFAEAVKAAGTTDAEALIDALEKICVSGPQGAVAMDAETHHASVNTYLARCQANGTFKIIRKFGCIPPRIPERYIAQLQTSHLHESPVSPEVTARLAAEIGTANRKISSVQHILSIADVAIIVADDQGIINEVNQCAGSMFGYQQDELIGMSVHLLLPPHFRQRHAELLAQFINGEELQRSMSQRSELIGYRKDGSFFPVEASIAKFRNGDRWFLAAIMRDVTKRKKAEEELVRRATHDFLTGLPNRATIRERLTSVLHRSRRNRMAIALLFIDLDGFKLINDTHGHGVGDRVLKAVAGRLLDQVRPGDTVGRLAGDEFVIVCEQVEQPAAMSVLAERINETLRDPFYFNDLPLFVTASIGIAIGLGSTHSADDMLRHGDTAMYAVKEKGRDGWQFFNENLQQQAELRLNITNGLRLAIERNELTSRFQPIVSADSGRIVGAEMLLRWKPPSGEISPEVFVPVAEMTGTIVKIGAWAFCEACLAERRWRERWGSQAPYISVNVSARQLNDKALADEFSAILSKTGADPTRLLLEITETSLMAEVDTNLRILRSLEKLGLRIAVDDFGTGYSSLAQLTRLPIHVIKIDRAFVEGIDKNPENRTVIRAIIGLGRELGIKLLAEGVENSTQRHELCVYGCHYFQGYYFHHPLDEKAFIETFDSELEGDSSGLASLHFLIYVSQSVGPMSGEALHDLSEQALANNIANGVSGCLVYQHGYFMQMLEGERDILYSLMEKIKADKRHANVRIVIEGPAKQRVFKEWGMFLHDLTQIQDAPDFKKWQQRIITFQELAEDARICYDYITAFRDRHY